MESKLMPCKGGLIKRIFGIRRFEPNKVYITHSVDGYFQYKMRVSRRYEGGRIVYEHPDGGQSMITVAQFEPFYWCESVTVRCSIYHDGMITFYADKPYKPEQEERQ